jgi:hypothetical protein
LINRNVTFDQQKEVLLFERVEEVLTSKIKKESPLFKIYLLLIDLLKNDFKSHKFSQLEKSFFKHQSLLTPKKKLDLFLLMINILSRQFNLGNKKIAKKIFTLCQKGLSSKILLYNNRISQEAFTNIISISCFLEKTKWGEFECQILH